MPLRYLGLLVFLGLGLQFGFAQPIVIDGVADRTTYVTASLAFRVQTTPGHSYLVLLDGQPVPAGVTNRVTIADYHQLFVARTNVTTGDVATRTVQFIVASPNRNTSGDGPENGLIEWTAFPQIPSTAAEMAGATLQLMAPADYPLGMEIPVIARVSNPSGHARRVNGSVTADGFPPFRVLRGHGSGFLPGATIASPVEYGAQLGPLGAYKEINIDSSTVWTTPPATLAGNVVWGINSRIHLTGSITISPGATLTIEAGTVVKINPLINITNRGRFVINGTIDRPVVLTATNRVAPHQHTSAWGGILMRHANAQFVVNNAILVGGGGQDGFANISPGFDEADSHRDEQPVFLVHSNSIAHLTNCAIINTAGQVGNGYQSDFIFDHCLFQRAITCGEYVGSRVIVNHSALIEFPEDDPQVNTTIANADYDAIYFTTGTHLVYNSLIGFCKDDAIDSGSGGAGTVLVTNCWFESALHEANAWSGGGRQATNYNSVIINSGQGFECGWSSGNNSPLTYAYDILSLGNSVGARFGDNYPSIGPYNGLLRMTNSFILYNYRDVWGFTWRNDSTGWFYRSNQMDIRSNWISQANAFHPSNQVWNGAQDGWRLAQFMTTPPNAPAGIGFATWSNSWPATAMFDGVPVRLSSFTTNAVQVDYAYLAGAQTVHAGTLTFVPGETVKRIFPYGFNPASHFNLRLILANPLGGDLTGGTNVQFQGRPATAVVTSFYPSNTQVDHARLQEGYPIRLAAPSGLPVEIGYIYDWSGGILRTGVVSFAPGETIAWAAPPDGSLDGIDIVRFELQNATLPAPLRAYYVKSSSTPAPPPTPLISMGATWRYPNVLGFPGATWRELGFDDGSWRSGPAQLGFGESDQATSITDFGPQNQVTYYFRRTFEVTDPAAFTNLSMTLLRDDGGVVHLNGREAYRSPNLPAPPAAITHTTTTLSGQNGENTIDTATLSATNLVSGQNIAAVEIHQQGASSSDLSFDFDLAANPIPPPPPPQEVHFGKFDGQLIIAWGDPTFVLEQADDLTGPWTTAASASPFVLTPNPSIPHRFFRLKQ